MTRNVHENKLFIYGKYSQVIEGIKYLQNEQMLIRFQVSQILLGTFTIIGALFYISADFLYFQPLLVGVIVPILSTILIHTRLIEDLVLKERIRIASFAKGLFLEKKYSWLPKFHSNMFHPIKGTHHGSAHRKSKYYLGCIGILFLLSFLFFQLMPNLSVQKRICFSILYLMVFIGYVIFINFSIKTTSDLIKRLKK